MRKIIFISILFFAGFFSSAYCEVWHLRFYNNIRGFNYDIAVEDSLISEVPVSDIVLISKRLGFDDIYIAARVYAIASRHVTSGHVKKKIEEVLDELFMAGIEPYIIEKATAMTLTDIRTGINTGEIYMPGMSEITMNYKRYYGDAEEELNEALAKIGQNEEQGLGFGDDPGLGLGPSLGLGEIDFGSGGNFDLDVSPSAP